MEDNGCSLLIIKKKYVKFSLPLSNCYYFGLVTFRKEEKPAVALLVVS